MKSNSALELHAARPKDKPGGRRANPRWADLEWDDLGLDYLEEAHIEEKTPSQQLVGLSLAAFFAAIYLTLILLYTLKYGLAGGCTMATPIFVVLLTACWNFYKCGDVRGELNES